MPAAVTPQIKLAAVFTKTDIAAIAKDNSLFLSANKTHAGIVRDNHFNIRK